MDTLICEKCKQPCAPLPAASSVTSSEWYCDKCHKSYPMSEKDANIFISMMRNKR